MHRKRWITGIIAVPILYLLIAAGGMAFYLLITVATVLTLGEYNRVVFPAATGMAARLIPLVGLCLAPLIVWQAFYGHLTDVLLIITVDLIAVAALTLPIFKTDRHAPYLVAKQVLGMVYITVPMASLVAIRSDANGALWIFWILCIVAAGDTGAFYAGTYLGRHKLCPWVSPKKTVEGSLGGLAANVLVALLMKLLLLPALAILPSIGFALAIGISGQVGDLFASEFKRSAGIKDSGSLLPGHGGFLDRLDALLFAAPLAYLLKIGIF